MRLDGCIGNDGDGQWSYQLRYGRLVASSPKARETASSAIRAPQNAERPRPHPALLHRLGGPQRPRSEHARP
jgi:hypothetical protein